MLSLPQQLQTRRCGVATLALASTTWLTPVIPAEHCGAPSGGRETQPPPLTPVDPTGSISRWRRKIDDQTS